MKCCPGEGKFDQLLKPQSRKIDKKQVENVKFPGGCPPPPTPGLNIDRRITQEEFLFKDSIIQHSSKDQVHRLRIQFS